MIIYEIDAENVLILRVAVARHDPRDQTVRHPDRIAQSFQRPANLARGVSRRC